MFYLGTSWGEFPLQCRVPPMIDQYCHKLIHLKTTSFDFPTVNLVSYTKTSYSITKCTIIDSILNGIRNFILFLWSTIINNIIVRRCHPEWWKLWKTFGRSGLCPKLRWGSSQCSPDSLAGREGACCPVPKNPSPLSAFGLDFRPFGSHSAVSPQILHFPPMLRGSR